MTIPADELRKMQMQPFANMTMRDLMAAMAMQGIVAHEGPEMMGTIVARAYNMADAMLEHRRSNPPK